MRWALVLGGILLLWISGAPWVPSTLLSTGRCQDCDLEEPVKGRVDVETEPWTLTGESWGGFVRGTIHVGWSPIGVAITPDGATALVTNGNSDSVSVVDLPTLTETATIPVGKSPYGVAVTPSGATALIANYSDHTVSVLGLPQAPGLAGRSSPLSRRTTNLP